MLLGLRADRSIRRFRGPSNALSVGGDAECERTRRRSGAMFFPGSCTADTSLPPDQFVLDIPAKVALDARDEHKIAGFMHGGIDSVAHPAAVDGLEPRGAFQLEAASPESRPGCRRMAPS
jgi:hypothetical protein